MTGQSSSSEWKPVTLPVFTRVARSDQTYSLESSQWPLWAANSTKFTRVLLHCPEAGIMSNLTTAQIAARLFTERLDPKDAPDIFNYDLYLLAETTDGRLFQSGPIPTTDPPHRLSRPSTRFDDYGPPPL